MTTSNFQLSETCTQTNVSFKIWGKIFCFFSLMFENVFVKTRDGIVVACSPLLTKPLVKLLSIVIYLFEERCARREPLLKLSRNKSLAVNVALHLKKVFNKRKILKIMDSSVNCLTMDPMMI